MALNFPSNPVDGQLYPDPAVTGATQYVWIDSKGTWLTVFKGVERVDGLSPITVVGSTAIPKVGIQPATPTQDGYLSAADKSKINSLPPNIGTVTKITAGLGLGMPDTGDFITDQGTIKLLAPTPIAIGGVKSGSTVSIDGAGTIDIKPPGSTRIGGVKAGSGVSIAADGSLSISSGGTFVYLDNISNLFNSVTVSFPLAVDGVPFFPSSPKSLLIFVGGVNQKPLNAFGVSGSSIIFSDPPPVGSSFNGVSLT